MTKKETAWDKVERDAVAAPELPDRAPESVLVDWVMRLGLRLQGVLVSAIRGCDTVQRHDNSKVLARIYRSEILRSHSGDAKKSKSFILAANIPTTVDYMQKFLNDNDHLPQHYVMHFLHAAEILGYYHPDPERRDMWNSFYLVACRKYHLRPEPAVELIDRLEKDEETFHKAQDTKVTAHVFEDNEKRRAQAQKEAEDAKDAKAAEQRQKAEAERSLNEVRYGQYGGS
jgi:hypothetical protein